MVSPVVAPAANVPTEQLTVCPVCLQLALLAPATKVRPAGSTVLTTTAVAPCGPRSPTVNA